MTTLSAIPYSQTPSHATASPKATTIRFGESPKSDPPEQQLPPGSLPLDEWLAKRGLKPTETPNKTTDTIAQRLKNVVIKFLTGKDDDDNFPGGGGGGGRFFDKAGRELIPLRIPVEEQDSRRRNYFA